MQQIREAFNKALGDAGSCIKAYLDYTREDGKQVQMITLFGSWADGENGIPMPDEPAFFNSSAPSEDSVTGADTERAPEALAS